MALPQKRFELRYTEEHYLKIERDSDERHEYIDGEIYLMSGESDEHGDISTNLVGELHSQLKGTPRRAKTKDTKVRSGPMPFRRKGRKGLYSYPDVVVICGKAQFLDEYKDVVVNPTVIIEVLSPTTEVYDRKEKFLRYQKWCPTLKDYILVSQDTPMVEHYIRNESEDWTYKVYSGLESNFTIESINCKLNLTDVYDRVEFLPDIEEEIEDEETQTEN